MRGGRKEGRNASIKKIVVIAIIAAAAAVITFIIDDVRRQEEQEEGISPSFHVIPTTSIEANENCRRNSRYFHFWMDGQRTNSSLPSSGEDAILYRSIY